MKIGKKGLKEKDADDEPEQMPIRSMTDIPEVKEVPVIVKNKGTAYKAIIRCKDDETQSIVTTDYQLIPHADVWKEVMKISKDKKYEIKNASLYRYGNAMVAELGDIKPVNVKIFENDEIVRGVRIFNSYDKSRALSVEGYGLRLVCTNGAVAPGFVSRYHKTHSYDNIDISELGKYIELGMESWSASADLLRLSAKKKIKVEPMIKSLKFPEKYETEIIGRVEAKDDFASVYSIWNAITNVITHDMSGNVQIKRLVKYQRLANTVFDQVRKEVAVATIA